MRYSIAVLRKVRYSSNALFGQCPVWPMPCLANAQEHLMLLRKAIVNNRLWSLVLVV